MDLKKCIAHSVEEAVRASAILKHEQTVDFIAKTSSMLAQTFVEGGKILIAGNGGSLCDAAHFAEELTGNFRKYRKALPALALADSAHLTCVANDFGFEKVFSRAVEAYGKAGDVFIGLTTSGNSPNIIQGFEEARKLGLKTIAFLGKGGGKLKGIADAELCVDGFSYSDRIQEVHMAVIHILIEIVELILFPEILSEHPLMALKPHSGLADSSGSVMRERLDRNAAPVAEILEENPAKSFPDLIQRAPDVLKEP